MQVPKILFVALVSHAFLTCASAAVEVYTTLAAWEVRVAAASPLPCISIDDFEDGDIPLVVGTTDVGLFDVTVDDVPFPLGQLGGSFKGIYGGTSGPTVFDFHNFDNAPIIAVAGDWARTTNNGKLQVAINGQLIKFDDHLTLSGNGFLGFVDEANGINTLSFSTGFPTRNNLIFFLDNVRAAGYYFGQAWQVPDAEPSLFHTVRIPKHPRHVCELSPYEQES
jgi:hypothetical protein